MQYLGYNCTNGRTCRPRQGICSPVIGNHKTIQLPSSGPSPQGPATKWKPLSLYFQLENTLITKWGVLVSAEAEVIYIYRYVQTKTWSVFLPNSVWPALWPLLFYGEQHPVSQPASTVLRRAAPASLLASTLYCSRPKCPGSSPGLYCSMPNSAGL